MMVRKGWAERVSVSKQQKSSNSTTGKNEATPAAFATPITPFDNVKPPAKMTTSKGHPIQMEIDVQMGESSHISARGSRRVAKASQSHCLGESPSTKTRTDPRVSNVPNNAKGILSSKRPKNSYQCPPLKHLKKNSEMTIPTSKYALDDLNCKQELGDYDFAEDEYVISRVVQTQANAGSSLEKSGRKNSTVASTLRQNLSTTTTQDGPSISGPSTSSRALNPQVREKRRKRFLPCPITDLKQKFGIELAYTNTIDLLSLSKTTETFPRNNYKDLPSTSESVLQISRLEKLIAPKVIPLAQKREKRKSAMSITNAIVMNKTSGTIRSRERKDGTPESTENNRIGLKTAAAPVAQTQQTSSMQCNVVQDGQKPSTSRMAFQSHTSSLANKPEKSTIANVTSSYSVAVADSVTKSKLRSKSNDKQKRKNDTNESIKDSKCNSTEATNSNPVETPVENDPNDTKPAKQRKRKPIVVPDHIIVNEDDPLKYCCKVCKKKFKTKAHVNYHRFCKDGKEKPYTCDTCGQGFISKAHFQYHLRTHTGERPYVCPKCGKGFNQRGKVTRHMRSHTGERPFKCPNCGKGFLSAQALRAHMLIHSGERPFACEVCTKRFTGATSLKKHMFTHSGERPLVCPICGKSFPIKWTLDLHIKTHSNVRPHKCDQCSRAFTNSKDLRRHMMIHSGERPYHCFICDAKFRRKDNLDRHIKNTHNRSKEYARRLSNEAAAEYVAIKNIGQKKSVEKLPETAPDSPVSPNSPGKIESEEVSETYILPDIEPPIDISRENVRHECTIDSSKIQIACTDVNGVAELQSPSTSQVYSIDVMRVLEGSNSVSDDEGGSGTADADSQRKPLELTKNDSEVKPVIQTENMKKVIKEDV